MNELDISAARNQQGLGSSTVLRIVGNLGVLRP